MRQILSKNGQKHDYLTLVTLFNDLDKQQIRDIVLILGLADLLNDDGEFAPMYGLDILSDKDRFLLPDNDNQFTLTGKLYNFFAEITDYTGMTFKWSRNSGDSTDSVWTRDKRVITLTDTDLTSKFKDRDVSFTLEVTLSDGSKISDTYTMSSVMTYSNIQIEASDTLFIENTPSKIDFRAKTQGINAATFKWYVDDQLVGSNIQYSLLNSKVAPRTAASIKLEVIDTKGNNYTDTITIPKVGAGKDGEPGIPGPPGEDGSPRYTWVKYADNEEGKNMSEYPTNVDGTFRPFIGLSENNDSPIESEDYRDYRWSKYIGEEGVPGENGYIWIKYSEFPKGRDTAGRVRMHDDPFDEDAGQFGEWLSYMGMAYNKQDMLESNIPEDYIWAKVKGEDGHTGYIFDLSNESHIIPTDSEGVITGATALNGAETDITLFYGNDAVPLVDYTVSAQASHTGITFSIVQPLNSNYRTLKITSYNTPNDSDYIDITARAQGEVISVAKFTLAKAKGVPAYSILPSVGSIRIQPGVGGLADTITPNTISAKVLKNTGNDVIETNEGVLTYRYSYSNGDGTAIAPNTSITLNNANSPKHIEFLFYHPLTNRLIDKEVVPFVRDGKNGDPGKDGQPGQPGEPGIPGSRGPMPRMLNWTGNFTYYRNAEYRDYIYCNHINPEIEGWYCVKENQENLYNTTAAGVKEYKASSFGGDVGPDKFYFEKQDFIDSQVFGTIVAENANLAGFIFKNQRLISQANRADGTTPKVILDGKNGLVDAEGAKFANSTFSSGAAGTQRIDINSNTNTLGFFLNGKNSPSINLTTGNGGGGNPAEENPVISILGKTTSNISERNTLLSNSGVFSNGSNMYFLSASSTATANSASVVGLYQQEDTEELYLPSIRSAVVGVNQFHRNQGRTFGGYFNTVLTGAHYKLHKNLSSGVTNYTATSDIGLYISYLNAGVLNFTLPNLPTIQNGWCDYGGDIRNTFELEIYLINESADIKIVTSGGANTIISPQGNVSTFTILNPGKVRLIWNGSHWIPIYTKTNL